MLDEVVILKQELRLIVLEVILEDQAQAEVWMLIEPVEALTLHQDRLEVQILLKEDLVVKRS